MFSLKYLQESPKFLYNKGRYVEARECLSKIAEFNGVVYNNDFTFDVEEELSIIKSEEERTLLLNETPNSDNEIFLTPSN